MVTPQMPMSKALDGQVSLSRLAMGVKGEVSARLPTATREGALLSHTKDLLPLANLVRVRVK